MLHHPGRARPARAAPILCAGLTTYSRAASLEGRPRTESRHRRAGRPRAHGGEDCRRRSARACTSSTTSNVKRGAAAVLGSRRLHHVYRPRRLWPPRPSPSTSSCRLIPVGPRRQPLPGVWSVATASLRSSGRSSRSNPASTTPATAFPHVGASPGSLDRRHCPRREVLDSVPCTTSSRRSS